MKKLFLIRHGSTAGNLEKRYIGRTDEPLCPEGIAQVEQLKTRKLTADRVFSSPALRAVQTAKMLFPNQAIQEISALREIDFGLFEGKNAPELENCLSYRNWVDSGCLDPIPGGEDVDLFKARCRLAFSKAMERLPDGGCAAFVIHGGCIMAILEGFAHPKRDFYSFHIKNGAYVQCEYEDGRLHLTGGALC